jgi:hypothetical protein
MALKKKEITKPRISHEHAIVMAASFLMLFSTFFFIGNRMIAGGEQGMQAVGVSAIVLPNEFNTKKAKEKNFFERVWDSLDPYQKLMAISSFGLGTLLIPAGALFAMQHRRSRQKNQPA